MDFVCDDPYVVAEADFAQPEQFLPGPYPSCGVVRIAQEEQFYLWVCGFFFQVAEVYAIGAVFVNQAIGYDLAPVVTDNREEAVVHRGLNEDFVARCGERFYDDGEGGDYSGGVEYPFFFDGQAVPPLEPADDGGVVGFRGFYVSEDAVFYSFFQGFNDCRSGAEVHIGYPHRECVFAFGCVPFEGVCSLAGNYFIEVVFHGLMCFVLPTNYKNICDLAMDGAVYPGEFVCRAGAEGGGGGEWRG